MQHTAHAASSVMIWPVDPVIEEDQRATALWLENRGTEPVSLQVRVFGWGQSGGQENFVNQEQLIASPPLAVIPPGQRQLIRLMNTVPVPDGKEIAYRVLVDELPDSDGGTGRPADPANSAIGVKLQIRYSIPLFVNGKGLWTKAVPGKPRDPATQAVPVLAWRTVREGGELFLAVRNSGAAHARLTGVQWVGTNPAVSGAAVVINPGLLGYVLADSEMRWPLTAPPPMGHVPEARVNGGETPQKLRPQ
ncbi:hypothetical protein RD110_14620 [Rhodoferax koreense]|uniref:Pili assembly chaperone N-terminal domain-containing protein n=2 Tax=Rhodoferax koreensis TaxID=1842727 RepID=A0A1P8K3Y8_9BURK|nr:hypothetical protein RD110_14620 [Rhodoferax koreense]